jgi:trans-aconitate methyltransferase
MSGQAPVLAGEPLTAIIAYVRERLAAGDAVVSVRVLDPDRGRGLYAGERVEVDGRMLVHRPWRVWVDLAERMGLRISTPRADGEGLVRIELSVLDERATWEPEGDVPAREKYGAGSGYQRISKLEDPGVVLDLADALERVGLGVGARVLDLGVNTGEELALLAALWPELGRSGTFVGVDHSASALAVARERLPEPRHRFVEADLATLPALELGGPFDLVVSLNTLQSPGVDDKAVLRHVVQERLSPTGSVILGIPNCRYLDGEVIHGARTKNLPQVELSLVIEGIAFYRRYLHQHRRRVYVTGKHTVLVTATPWTPPYGTAKAVVE